MDNQDVKNLYFLEYVYKNLGSEALLDWYITRDQNTQNYVKSLIQKFGSKLLNYRAIANVINKIESVEIESLNEAHMVLSKFCNLKPQVSDI